MEVGMSIFINLLSTCDRFWTRFGTQVEAMLELCWLKKQSWSHFKTKAKTRPSKKGDGEAGGGPKVV
eukprot:12399227-Karenia_brevis.AAC.1